MPRGHGPKPVAEAVAVRLRAAQAEVNETAEAHELAIERRDAIVVEAIDLHGASQLGIARVLGVAKSRVSSILANSQPGEEE